MRLLLPSCGTSWWFLNFFRFPLPLVRLLHGWIFPKKKVKLAQRPLQKRAMNTLLNPLKELKMFKIFSFESSLRLFAKTFRGLFFSPSCSTKLSPLTLPDASGEEASVPRLRLSFDCAVRETKPPFGGRIWILLNKFDTSAGLFGSNCVPAASFSGILNGGLKMLSILEKMDLVCKELHSTLVFNRRWRLTDLKI